MFLQQISGNEISRCNGNRAHQRLILHRQEEADHSTQPEKDAAGFQKFIAALRQRGFSAEDVEKIACRNWLRTLKTAWKEA